MATNGIVKFSDLMPEDNSRKQTKNFKTVSDVINQKLIIERFEFSKNDRGQDILYIHTENFGIVRTGSTVLMKQAKLIERNLTGNKMEAQIRQGTSTKSGSRYFTFADM